MTKNIEGTVDDDIAAKLAIGEGRQVGSPFPFFDFAPQSIESRTKRAPFLFCSRLHSIMISSVLDDCMKSTPYPPGARTLT